MRQRLIILFLALHVLVPCAAFGSEQEAEDAALQSFQPWIRLLKGE